MEREVIQDFLNVPGIAGVALMDGLSPPYFHGFAANFDLPQQGVIAQSVQQVLETTPEGFNSFEFQFDRYRVYLHKLNQGITLLVLTDNHLPRLAYTRAVRRLLIELQIGQENPIAAFRLLTAEAAPASLPASQPAATPPAEPQSEQVLETEAEPNAKPNPTLEPAPVSTSASAPSSNSSSKSTPSSNPNSQSPSAPELISAPPSSPPPPQPPGQPPNSSGPRPKISSVPVGSTPASKPVSLKDVLAAINALTQLTTQYLGTMVVANYWKTTRPAVDWLNHFQIERSAQMTFAVQVPSERLPILSPSQHQCLKEWVAAFIERCSKVIRNFAKIVRHSLDKQQSALLFDDIN